jgi:hypothetical protein
VRDLLASCGCAAPRISYRAEDGTIVQGDAASREGVIRLPAGATADLAVEIDTEHVPAMNQDKLAQVSLRSDSKTTPFLIFEIHLKVERVMRAVPAEIEVGQAPQSAGKSGRTIVTVDLPGSRARVLGIESVEGPYTATVDETEMAGVKAWIVVASVNPGLPVGPVSGRVSLSVSGDDGTGVGLPFQMTARAQISPDVVLRPPVFLFGAFERGKSAKIEGELVALVPGERVRVTGTQVSGISESAAREITVEAAPIEPGDDGRAEKWKVVMRTSEKLADAAFSGTLVVALDHPRVSEIRVAFFGTTR